MPPGSLATGDSDRVAHNSENQRPGSSKSANGPPTREVPPSGHVAPSNASNSTNSASLPPSAPPPPPPTMSSVPQPTIDSKFPQYKSHIPFSMRAAPRLDLNSVERKGYPTPRNSNGGATAPREAAKRVRPHGLQEGPTFHPTEEEFHDPMAYIRKIAPEGRKYGICKIVPPDRWRPKFAIDTEKFHFRTRKQELHSVEGSTRTNLNYLDQLHKFHKQQGMNLNRFPSVDKRPLDLYKLKKAVETRGGFDKVCKLKKWAEIGRDLGYSGKIMSSLSTSLKNSYQKWLEPYEEYLRRAKPGVQQQMEAENGTPLTPSMFKPRSNEPSPVGGRAHDSPSVHASAVLNATIKAADENGKPPPPPEPQSQAGGFTPANGGGFTPVNLGQSSFQPVNAPPATKIEKDEFGTPNASAINTPEYRPSPTFPNLSNGHALKRTISHDSMRDDSSDTLNGEGDGSSARRSKRQRRDVSAPGAPTVAGSHMSLLRPLQPRMAGAPAPAMTNSRVSFGPNSKPGERCEGCGQTEDPSNLVQCEGCDVGYHRACISDPPANSVSSAATSASAAATASGRPVPAPLLDWHCPRCLVGTGEFGFEEGGIYGLRQFQEKANQFKASYFAPRMQYDPVLNRRREATEDDVEREFWRLVESITETVEVEYGADIHSTAHGSGFPQVETDPTDQYSTDPWNLNILPLHPEGLFRFIKSDISGMTVPWLYVGMCFSTFCWHNEDHYTYSANYQHLGATKTWYGIPGADAERFERAMREAVPELFEQQPDLLFQLVTLLPPDQLRKAGVNVYALDQRAGQFVITFPQAYHAGFNHGFNFNEAVNFAPADWEPFGQAGIERLQDFRRQPCFSHDELLITAAERDTTITTAKWLGPALQRMLAREMAQRGHLIKNHAYEGHRCKLDRSGDEDLHAGENATDEQPTSTCKLVWGSQGSAKMPDEDYQCVYCKAYCYLARVKCEESGKIMCLQHAGGYQCCSPPSWSTDDAILVHRDHELVYRYHDAELAALVQKVVDRARMPEAWQEKLDKVLEDEPRPPLKTLRSLVSEGERIPYELHGLADLKTFVERCQEWVDEAQGYITRKQTNRRKNERAWRRNTGGAGGSNAQNGAKEGEDRERELRRIENIEKLLSDAEALSFDCPEIATLRERAAAINDFRLEARAALTNGTRERSADELVDLAALGKGFNVDIPEVEQLETAAARRRWEERARELKVQVGTALALEEVEALVTDAASLPPSDPASGGNVPELLAYWNAQLEKGREWEVQARDYMSAEVVHLHQLEAMSSKAAMVPTTRATRAEIEGHLARLREAHRQIADFQEKAKDPDYNKRPKYRAVREALDSLAQGNAKGASGHTSELQNEVKRHEDWMRRGKRLFGKANAPLHILKSHMMEVAERNQHCLSLEDKPRMPVEPASRANSPEEGDNDGLEAGSRDIFCICRKPELGMMIECDLCHEWYHGKCLKIARGKIKEDDKYTCPICDYRVKIPRDAARPKLEELQDWQKELTNLPFQADEEEVLEELCNTGEEFRDFLRPYTNPLVSTPDDATTQRFWLRKLEGADILLANETNFFRQELHKWAPVAPEPPPILEHSASTRKPRPTKQQKLMQQYGVNQPEDLPLHVRQKQHTFKAHRKPGEAAQTQRASRPHPLQPAPTLHGKGGAPVAASPGTPNGLVSASTGPPSAASTGPHPYRVPPPLSPSHHPDPNYANMFATSGGGSVSLTDVASPPSARRGSAADFVKTSSPPFSGFRAADSSLVDPALKSPGLFQPSTPNGVTGPGADGSPRVAQGSGGSSTGPLDPSLLASPTDFSFAAAALHDSAAAGGLAPSSSAPGVDTLFAAFTHDDEDDGDAAGGGSGAASAALVGGGPDADVDADDPAAVRNEAGEALEGLGLVGAGAAEADEAEREAQAEREEARKLADEFLAAG